MAIETSKEQLSVVDAQTETYKNVMNGKKINAQKFVGDPETLVGDPLEELIKTMKELKDLISKKEDIDAVKLTLIGQLNTVIATPWLDVNLKIALQDLNNKLIKTPNLVDEKQLESMVKDIDVLRQPELTKNIELALNTTESALFFEVFKEALMPVGNHDASKNEVWSYVHQWELQQWFYDQVSLLWNAKNQGVNKDQAQQTFYLLLSNLSHPSIRKALTTDPSFKDTLRAIAIQQCAHKMMNSTMKGQESLPPVLRQGMTTMSEESALALARQYFDTGVLKLQDPPIAILGTWKNVSIDFKVVWTPLFEVTKDKDWKEKVWNAVAEDIANLRSTISTEQKRLQLVLDKKKQKDQTEQEKQDIVTLWQQLNRLNVLIRIVKKDISTFAGTDDQLAVINMIYDTSYTNKDNMSDIRKHITANPVDNLTIGRVVTMIAGSSLNLMPQNIKSGPSQPIPMVNFAMNEKSFNLKETLTASQWKNISTKQIFISWKSDLDYNSKTFVQMAEKQLADDMIIEDLLKGKRMYKVTITAHTDNQPYADDTAIIKDYRDHEAMYAGNMKPAMTPHQKKARDAINKSANAHPKRWKGNQMLAIDRAYEQYKEFTKNLPQNVLDGTSTQKVEFVFDVKEQTQRLWEIDIIKN